MHSLDSTKGILYQICPVQGVPRQKWRWPPLPSCVSDRPRWQSVSPGFCPPCTGRPGPTGISGSACRWTESSTPDRRAGSAVEHTSCEYNQVYTLRNTEYLLPKLEWPKSKRSEIKKGTLSMYIRGWYTSRLLWVANAQICVCLNLQILEHIIILT